MPYGISQNQPDCSQWAAVVQREDGTYETLACYDTKQDAIDRMIAQSLAEDLEPLGEVGVREKRQEQEILVVDIDGTLLADNGEPMADVIAAVNASEYPVVLLTGRPESERSQTVDDLSGAGVIYERIIMNQGSTEADAIAAYKQDAIRMLLDEGYEIDAFVDNVALNRDAVASLGVDVYSPEDFVADETAEDMEDPEGDDPEMEYESRAVSMVAPEFMAESARRGLEFHEQGLSGDGLRPATVADARKMANGEALSEAKWRRIAPWIARHIVDLDAVEGDDITPGLVAMLLWGGGSTKESARRAQAYAERTVQQMDAERQSRRKRQRKVVKSSAMADLKEVRWCVKEENEKRSIAFTTLEARQVGEGNKLIGYASVFDSPSEPMPFVEYVRRGAFAKTLNDGADVRLLIDHEGVPLARTKSGTLMLEEDDRGLRVEATLDPSNPDAARVISAMKRGDISQMSFAFRTIKDSWNNDRSVRELKEVQLFDVSVVTFPAYEETVAEIRSGQNAAEVTTLSASAPVRLRSAQIALARRHSRD